MDKFGTLSRNAFLFVTAACFLFVGFYFIPPLFDSESDYTPPPSFASNYVSGLDVLTLEHNPLPADSLSEEELLGRLSRLYNYQADMMAAEASGNEERFGNLINRGMREIRELMQHPGVTDEPRFQRIYQHMVAEYESHFGVPDTTMMPQGSIFAIRADMFAEMDRPTSPQLEAAKIEELMPEEADIPLPVNSAVESGIGFMQGGHSERWLKRMETYFPMIEHIFAEEGVPDELKYLAVVESGLNPTAVSHMGAGGLWQFMPETGRAYGLEITPWVDERMDPEKATRAAARHLRDLYELFGNDWHLALAGYNFSPPRLRQVLRDHGASDYWDVRSALPRETQNYVPSYIATTIVLSNPAGFGLNASESGPRYRYDYVPVQGMIEIETLAELAGTTEEEIRALNPELRAETLPPSADGYKVRLPYNSYPEFVRAFRELPDEEKNLTLTHEVRSGETVGGITRRYNVDAATLREVNNFEGTNIRAGEELVIPLAESDTTGIEGVQGLAGDPVSIRYGTRTTRPLAADGSLQSGIQPSPASQQLTIHTVRPGDSLYSIARRYDVSVRDLRQWNNLSSNALQPGQEIKIQG